MDKNRIEERTEAAIEYINNRLFNKRLLCEEINHLCMESSKESIEYTYLTRVLKGKSIKLSTLHKLELWVEKDKSK